MGIRSQIENRRRFTGGPQGYDPKRFVLFCILSLAVHVVFFVSVFWIHDFEFTAPKPRVVRVDLVSFVPGPIGGAIDPEPVTTQTPEPDSSTVSLDTKPISQPVETPAPIPVIKPDISLKTKPKNIKELIAARKPKEKPLEKKKTEKLKPKPKKDPKKELEKARQEMAKKVEKKNQEQIDEALKRLQAAIASKEAGKGNAAGSGSGSGMGTKGSSPLTLYQMLVKSAIEQNWVYNDLMAGLNQNLEVTILVKVLKSGEIRDISYETRSGNRYLDESAKKAIQRANPLPELPKGLSSYEFGLIFSPRGLK